MGRAGHEQGSPIQAAGEPRGHASLTTSIFTFLATSPDISPKLLRRAFLLDASRTERRADFLRGFRFARRVLAVFEKLVVDRPDGDAS